MSRETFVWSPEAGRMVPKSEQRRAAGGVQIIRDFADHVVNPADGHAYSTRPAYEAATRRAGAIEIGHTEHRKMQAAYVARGRRGHDAGPSVESSIRQALERNGG